MPAGLRVHNHNNALEILQSRSAGLALKELTEFWIRMPLIRFAGKSEKNPSLEYLQTCMNPLINDVLRDQYGWYTQVDLPGGTKGNNFDFYKKWPDGLRVWMEVEFANSARIDSDIRKLRTAFNRGLSDVGILVVCTDELAPRVDMNIATFETARDTILSEACNDFPCLILGLERNPDRVLDVTHWGYALEQLKRESNQDIKSHLAARIWTDHLSPSLPADSMHVQHLENVKMLGFNPGLQKPVFPAFTEEATLAPDVLTLNEDGSLSLFKEVPKQSTRATKAVPKVKPTAANQLTLALETETPALEIREHRGPENPPNAAATQACLAFDEIPPPELNSEPPSPPFVTISVLDQDPSAPTERSTSTNLTVPLEASDLTRMASTPGSTPYLARPADIVVPQYPAPRPVPKSSEGPRLGPWLARGAAAASPFVTRFA